VSFAHPLVLFALLVLPVLGLLYLLEQRNRRAAAAAFAMPALQPSVAPDRPGWRRHLPMLALGVALAVLVLAAAKPQRTVAVVVERASIVLATDTSGSMTATDVRPSRLVAAKRAGLRFVDEVPSRVNVGVLAFNGTVSLLQNPTRQREPVRAAIRGMQPSGATATGEAIGAATSVLRQATGAPAARRRGPPAAVLLLSDGTSTRGRDPLEAASAARRVGVRVYTVALGTQNGTITVRRKDGSTRVENVPPDPSALAEIARRSGGKAYSARSTDRLKEIYEQLGSELGRKNEKREITNAFAGGGLVLLLAGIAMSMRWFGRLI
jgi:Ca-activated chloride channel family protein